MRTNPRHTRIEAGSGTLFYAQGPACARGGLYIHTACTESPTCVGLQVLPEDDEAACGVWSIRDQVEDFDNVVFERELGVKLVA
jgi:hypothetical protein